MASDTWVDVDAFEEAASVARQVRDIESYRAAIAFCRGDLADELGTPFTPNPSR